MEEFWSPIFACRLEKRRAKADAYSPMAFPSTRLQRSFSLRRGLDFDLERFQAEHHLLFGLGLVARSNEKGDPLWVALVWFAMRLEI